MVNAGKITDMVIEDLMPFLSNGDVIIDGGNSNYKKTKEEMFCSILPTATQYARNAIFSGLMPSDMEKLFPQYWKNDTDEGGKNMHEADFLETQMKRLGLSNLS